MTATAKPDKDYSFPFSDVDEEDLDEINSPDGVKSPTCGHQSHEHLNLQTFDYTEHKMYEMEDNIDPENHHYNNVDCICEYYTD